MNWITAVVSEATGTLHRASEGLKLAVNQDNILQAARIIETEAEHFKRQVLARSEQMYIDRLGGDPVSGEVARVLTSKFVLASDSYINRCLDYATMLEKLAKQLGESALTYGYTEEQVTQQFSAAKAEGADRSLDLARPVRVTGHGGLRAN
jgi:hypothetical protein